MLPVHEQFIEKATAVLQQDHRVIGLLAGGSMISGSMDEFSDLDLIVVYAPEYREEIMNQRMTIVSGMGSVLSAFTGEHVGEPRLMICLYEGAVPLHVDFKFVMPKELEKRVEDPIILWERGAAISAILQSSSSAYPYPDPQWIEDRFWVWVHYAATKLGRGELFEVIDVLGNLRHAVLGPLLLAGNGRLPNGTRRLEQYAAEAIPELKETVATHDVESCYLAMQSSIRLYRRLRLNFAHVEHRKEAERASTAYLDTVYRSLIQK